MHYEYGSLSKDHPIQQFCRRWEITNWKTQDALCDLIEELDMGHHIDDKGRFQSDKHPQIGPDKIVLSFRDPAAKAAIQTFANATQDEDLGDDIKARLLTLFTQDRIRTLEKEIEDLQKQLQAGMDGLAERRNLSGS